MKIQKERAIQMAILVSALGYFVDVFDIALFSILRVSSLKSLGLPDDQVLSTGLYLLNIQMLGMLTGGLIWGILGDKIGRIQVLFGSILLYSVANIGNAFVHGVESYAVWRFIAGFGLAGEIGAGITLVSELMSKESRGYGTTIVASVGLCGGIAASMVGDYFDWRTAYIIGGVLGLVLLVLRVSVCESGVFNSVKEESSIKRGDLKLLFLNPRRLTNFVGCVLAGTAIWFFYGIIVALSPEIGVALGISQGLKAAHTTFYYAVGAAIGDLLSGLLSQYYGTRKKILLVFNVFIMFMAVMALSLHNQAASTFYTVCFLGGVFCGYWAVFITASSEQFGTNLRATVTTMVPNCVRGMIIPMTFILGQLRGELGLISAIGILGIIVFSFCFVSILRMRETFGIDLNYVEIGKETKSIYELQNSDDIGKETAIKSAAGWK